MGNVYHPDMPGRIRSLAQNETARVVAFLTIWKASFFGFVYLSLELLPTLFSHRLYWLTFHFPKSAPPPSWIELQTWDAQHYLYLSEYGFQAGEPSTAFFPLWPYCIKALAPLFGGNHLFAGLFLANVLSIVGLTLFWRFVLRRFGDRQVADTALLLTLCYPGSLFFGFPYSEAVFFLVGVAAIDALARGDWRAAALISFFLPLVRGIGIFIGAPMLYVFVRDWRRDKHLDWKKLGWMLVPVAGLLSYLAFMYLETGSPTSGMKAQDAFISNRSILDLVDVPGLFGALADVEWGHAYKTSALDRLFFLLFAGALVVLWRRDTDKTLFFYALPMGLIPAMTSFMSYTRYVVVVFPVFIAGALLLAPERRRHARWVAVGTLLVIQALLTIRYINFRWAG